MQIILLAAGLSHRMGLENKLLLPFDDKTILGTTLENIIAADLGNITVVIGHESDKVRDVLKKYPTITIIENKNYTHGMTSSIQAAVKNISDDVEGFMICLSDMPFILPTEYKQIADFFISELKQDEKLIVQPQFKNITGNPIVFSDYFKKEILEHTAPEGCREIVQKNKGHLKKIEMPTDNVLRDIDNRNDYEKINR